MNFLPAYITQQNILSTLAFPVLCLVVGGWHNAILRSGLLKYLWELGVGSYSALPHLLYPACPLILKKTQFSPSTQTSLNIEWVPLPNTQYPCTWNGMQAHRKRSSVVGPKRNSMSACTTRTLTLLPSKRYCTFRDTPDGQIHAWLPCSFPSL